MADFQPIILSVFGLILTFYAMHRVTDSYFVESLEQISTRMRMTSDIAGASLMAIGSSAPELFTSLLALLKGVEYAELGAGTIIGSALFNVLVIIGGTALIGTAVLNWQPAVRDIVFYIASILLLFLVIRDGLITLGESILFVCFYGVYLIALPLWRRAFPYQDQVDSSPAIIVEEAPGVLPWYWWWTVPIDWLFSLIMPDLEKRPGLYWLTFVLSIAAICFLSWGLVEAGVVLALTMGVPEAIIGLTVLAVGTSIPDLMGSLIVARQGKGDMAVSNAVGSNIFDILVGLGVVWMVVILLNNQSIVISQDELHTSMVLLLSSVVLLLGLFLLMRWRIGRRSGFALVSVYGLYLAAVIGGWVVVV